MGFQKNEIEIKFKILNSSQLDKIKEVLDSICDKKLDRVFEKTIRFDTKDMFLEKHNKFIRVRSGYKNSITFKKKIVTSYFKEREETEFEIEDIEKMTKILNELGFDNNLIMEKYRQKWIVGDLEIVIDELPFGIFIEIEGEKEDITKMIEKLDLKSSESSNLTYWDIWDKLRSKDSRLSKSIIFDN